MEGDKGRLLHASVRFLRDAVDGREMIQSSLVGPDGCASHLVRGDGKPQQIGVRRIVKAVAHQLTKINAASD